MDFKYRFDCIRICTNLIITALIPELNSVGVGASRDSKVIRARGRARIVSGDIGRISGESRVLSNIETNITC